MKNMNKALALVLALVMTMSLSISAWAAVTVEWDKAAYEAAATKITEVPADLSGKTVILHTNDVHGAIDKYAKVAALKADFEAAGATVILIDAGDYSSGDPNVSLSQGKSAIELMNAVGYDYATLGNHEFDYGWATLQENLKDAKFAVLTDVAYEGKTAFDVCKVVEVNGIKLGLFGLTTPETATKAHPGKTKGVTWPAEAEMEKIAQDAVDQLKAGGADIVIGITHLGVEGENVPNSSRDLLKAVTGVDLLIDGHSHTVMTKGEGGEPIQSTGTKLANVGVIVIDNAAKKIESNCLFDLTDYAKGVEAVKTISDRVAGEVEAEYGAVFATSEVDLFGANKIARYHETNLGDLIADALLWFVKDGGSDVITVPLDQVVALTNGGGIREDIKAGEITKKAVNTVLPFGNTVKVVYVTGAALLEALEASTRSFPMGGFPQVSGIKFTIDDTKQYNEGEQYPGSTYYAPKTIERVTIESINGKAFDPEATYAVITNDFLADGGDTYYAFAASSAQFDTSIPMDEVVMEYIKTELKGVVTAAKYGEARGDVKIWAPTTVKANQYDIELDGAKVTLNTVAVIDAKGNETNYVRLRDMAALLSGSKAQFDVDWDKESGNVLLKKDSAYTAIGGEGEAVFTGTPSYKDSPAETKIGDEAISVTAILLNKDGGGYTYYQLRDLGRNLGFNVGWSADRGIYVESAVAYNEAN